MCGIEERVPIVHAAACSICALAPHSLATGAHSGWGYAWRGTRGYDCSDQTDLWEDLALLQTDQRGLGWSDCRAAQPR